MSRGCQNKMDDAVPKGVHEIQVTLRLDGHAGNVTAGVPDRSMSMLELLPVMQDFTGAVVQMAEQVAEREGKSISCCAGCGACCSQLVPIAPVEAIHLERVVDTMPEPRRSAIRKRFAEAIDRLQEAGMLEQLEDVMGADNVDSAERQRIGDDYFRIGLPCPFLEEGSCSIYADRPLICREYLVTSPAVHCERPTPETIDVLPLPAKSARALISLGAERSSNSLKRRWIPLPLALRFAQQVDRKDWPGEDPAVELFADFLERAQSK